MAYGENYCLVLFRVDSDGKVTLHEDYRIKTTDDLMQARFDRIFKEIAPEVITYMEQKINEKGIFK